MEINSDYDSFIKRIGRLNLYLGVTSLSLIFFAIVSVIFLASNLFFIVITIFVYSIIFGIIAPKPPESVNIKAPDGSEFTNSATYNSSNSEYLNEFNDSSTGITLPTTRRNLNPDSSIESISKLNPKVHSLNFSSILIAFFLFPLFLL